MFIVVSDKLIGVYFIHLHIKRSHIKKRSRIKDQLNILDEVFLLLLDDQHPELILLALELQDLHLILRKCKVVLN